MIVNTESLVSVGLPSVSLTLTRHWFEETFGTVQENEPSLAVDEVMVDHEVPLFDEYSIFTFPTLPEEVQVIDREEPAAQLSLPLGDFTVMEAVEPPYS